MADGTCHLCGAIVPLAELDIWDGQRLCEACYPPECDCPDGSPCKEDPPTFPPLALTGIEIMLRENDRG